MTTIENFMQIEPQNKQPKIMNHAKMAEDL